MRALLERSRTALTVLHAPAGAGKTAAVAHWAGTAGRATGQVLHVRITPEACDGAAVTQLVLEAAAAAGMSADLLARLRPEAHRPGNAAAPVSADFVHPTVVLDGCGRSRSRRSASGPRSPAPCSCSRASGASR